MAIEIELLVLEVLQLLTVAVLEEDVLAAELERPRRNRYEEDEEEIEEEEEKQDVALEISRLCMMK